MHAGVRNHSIQSRASSSWRASLKLHVEGASSYIAMLSIAGFLGQGRSE